jgi:hypothetical protein
MGADTGIIFDDSVGKKSYVIDRTPDTMIDAYLELPLGTEIAHEGDTWEDRKKRRVCGNGST